MLGCVCVCVRGEGRAAGCGGGRAGGGRGGRAAGGRRWGRQAAGGGGGRVGGAGRAGAGGRGRAGGGWWKGLVVGGRELVGDMLALGGPGHDQIKPSASPAFYKHFCAPVSIGNQFAVHSHHVSFAPHNYQHEFVQPNPCFP